MDDMTYPVPPESDFVGVSLKNQHFTTILTENPSVSFFEIHAENFMSEGGNHLRFLDKVAETYPLSIHGVGMSLGSAEGLSDKHLQAFRTLMNRYDPLLVSEHLAWVSQGGYYLNDLLPLPLTKESLKVVSDNIKKMQDVLGRKILVENPSAYLAFDRRDFSETEFLIELVSETSCGLLLDINNVFVSASNMGWCAEEYIDAIPASAVGEVHLAGHTLRNIDGAQLRIDDHGSVVNEDVWSLYRRAISLWGAKPTLVEWDTNVPEFSVLMEQALQARMAMNEICVGEH